MKAIELFEGLTVVVKSDLYFLRLHIKVQLCIYLYNFTTAEEKHNQTKLSPAWII